MIPNIEGDYSYCKYKKRCSYPNSLIDNKKGDISVALCTLAPLIGGMLQPFSLFELATIKKLKG
jgi:hypothetical protein